MLTELPKFMKSKQEVFPPSLPVALTERVLPRIEESTTLKDIPQSATAAPNCTFPFTLKLDPSRANPRRLMPLPKLALSNTDTLCPYRANDRSDMLDPMWTHAVTDAAVPILALVRRLTLLPIPNASKTLTRKEVRTFPRMLRELPTWQRSNTDTLLPNFPTLRIEMLDPK
jgi:hypothetical protein